MVVYLEGAGATSEVQFVYFDATNDACETCPIDGSLEVEINGEHGSFENPVLIDSRCEDLSLDVALQAGWNYVSTPLEQADPSVASVFDTALNGNLLKVLGDNQYALSGNYTPGIPEVFNTLVNVSDAAGFVIKVESDAIWTSAGAPLDPENTPLVLHQGWNIIGFVPQEELPLEEALDGIMGSLERVIDGQNGLVFHIDNPAPLNTLQSMEPGRAYWVKLSADANLYFPGSLSGITVQATGGGQLESVTPTLRTDGAAAAQAATGWDVNRLPFASQIVGRVTVDEWPVVGEAYLGVFADGICCASMPLSAWNGNTFGAMAVYTEGPEMLQFKLWLDGEILASEDSWTAVPGQSYGDVLNGFPEIRFSTIDGVDENLAMSIAVFPSPADEHVQISWPGDAARHLQIVDATGRLIEDRQKAASPWKVPVKHLAGGMYFVRSVDSTGLIVQPLVIQH